MAQDNSGFHHLKKQRRPVLLRPEGPRRPRPRHQRDLHHQAVRRKWHPRRPRDRDSSEGRRHNHGRLKARSRTCHSRPESLSRVERRWRPNDRRQVDHSPPGPSEQGSSGWAYNLKRYQQNSRIRSPHAVLAAIAASTSGTASPLSLSATSARDSAKTPTRCCSAHAKSSANASSTVQQRAPTNTPIAMSNIRRFGRALGSSPSPWLFVHLAYTQQAHVSLPNFLTPKAVCEHQICVAVTAATVQHVDGNAMSAAARRGRWTCRRAAA